MKVLFAVLLLVAGALAKSAVQQQHVEAEGPACPIEDPLARDGPLPLNVTLDPLLKLDVGSEVTNLIVEGLSTLHYEVNINALLLTASFEVTLARVTGNATYSAAGYVDARPFRQETIPSGNVTGSGFGKVSANDVHLKGRASLFINIIGNKVQISNLNLETVSFSSLSVDLGSDITVGGSPVDWAQLSANIKANFDRDLAEHKSEITNKIRQTANTIVGRYTLAELIDLIGGGGGGGGDPEC